MNTGNDSLADYCLKRLATPPFKIVITVILIYLFHTEIVLYIRGFVKLNFTLFLSAGPDFLLRRL